MFRAKNNFKKECPAEISAASSGRAIGQHASFIHSFIHSFIEDARRLTQPSFPPPTTTPMLAAHIPWATSDKESSKDARIRTHSTRLLYDQCCCRPPPSPFFPVLSVCSFSPGDYISIAPCLICHVCMWYIKEAGSASLKSSTPPKLNLHVI